ncbi:16S rRNA (cytosine(967)-C(5))-methyltransferase RsmB [Desulfopila sp. IMCC35008]|uniref:16S rRNA (cytosine(967)-C(5))-methyltransferase RsmB n=1 Tax=Desulfopila sp. IMCC35008 TaxID=2653858 RepID=UPI0013D88793|nr:16S rRNA (cytosine(967)-C(5))-methyltransferase RsmB [Desulfopila sp. IMCC35008]
MKNTSTQTGRYAAIETLCRLQKTAYPVKPLLESVSSESALSSADRALTMNLVYGVLRKRQYLDSLIGQLSRHPLKKLDVFVLNGLRVGLYQIFFLDRIPESAAVNETVNAMKAARLPKRLHGFVNGILRESIRQKQKGTLPSPEDESTASLLNHPEWMTRRWSARFGQQEMERICRANNEEPLLTLRANTSRISRENLLDLFLQDGLDAAIGHYAPDSIVLPCYQGSINKLPGYKEGYFQPQDEAAQLAALLLSPFRENGVYLDGCAGLGGKTSHILQLTQPYSARVIAVEPEPRRQRLFEDNITRLSDDNRPVLHKKTLQDYSRTSRILFSGVFIDAPCSGTGVTGRHPDIRWNRKPEDFISYQRIQLEILNHAAQLVAENGILVYATCSLEQEENMDVVTAFLKENEEYNLTDCRPFLPEKCQELIADNCFSPHPDSTIDGFFGARLVRQRR